VNGSGVCATVGPRGISCGRDDQCGREGERCCALTGKCFATSEPWRCESQPDESVLDCRQSSDCQSGAWAIQAELRGHTKGSLLQLTGGLGLALATANMVRSDAGLDASLARPAQPWLTGDLGARLLLGPFFIGVSVGGAPLQQQWLGSLNLGVIAFGG
jgi:hypothetical protein